MYTDMIGSKDININNGTVYPDGNIKFTITEIDTEYFTNGYGNQITITYTSTTWNGRVWKGTWSDSNGDQGPWNTN